MEGRETYVEDLRLRRLLDSQLTRELFGREHVRCAPWLGDPRGRRRPLLGKRQTKAAENDGSGDSHMITILRLIARRGRDARGMICWQRFLPHVQ